MTNIRSVLDSHKPHLHSSFLALLLLTDQTRILQGRLLTLCDDDSEIHDLTLSEASSIITALGQVQVLDPAVGTVSMLVGFLNAVEPSSRLDTP